MAAGLAVLSLAACSSKPDEQAPIRNPGNLARDAYPPRGWTTSSIPSQGGLVRRYGVASPPHVPRAEVMILPERAPVEAWLPVVNALTARNYTVWIADPQPAPLLAVSADILRSRVIRGGASGRIFVLGQGRGALAALNQAPGTLGVVLWAPVLGSAPYRLPAWESRLMRGLGLGDRPLLGQPPWREGEPAGDPLAQAWMKANPRLRPAPPTYAGLYAYEAERRAPRPAYAGEAPVWISGGDAAAGAACRTTGHCRPIAPGVEAMIAAFDEATKDVTLGAPPPPQPKRPRTARAT